jgi:hypothetical protein
MAFKLNKDQDSKLDTLLQKLVGSYDNLKTSVEEYNTGLKELQSKVEGEVSKYNEDLSNLKSFVDEVTTEKREEFDDKSETWQEGENGQAAEEWISTWEGAELQEITLQFPDELEIDFDPEDLDLPSEP